MDILGGGNSTYETGEDIGPSSQYDQGCKVFIGQIPKDMNENDLRPYLEEFGTIVEVSIIRERDRENGTFISKGWMKILNLAY